MVGDESVQNTNARIPFQAVDVVALIDGVLDELEPLCREWCVSVEFVGRGVEQAAAGRFDELERLFRLLLEPIIEKAAPGGHVEILLRRVHASLLVCLRDQVGDAARDSQAAGPSDRSDEPGFCCQEPVCKLTECREIVAGHGGELWAWKTLRGGTVVCFDLPIQADTLPNGSATGPAAVCAPLADVPDAVCLTSN